MLTTAELMAAAKARAGIPSNYRLAKVLGVTETTVMRWNTGRSTPDDEPARRLAELAELDAGFVVASIRAEREKSGPMFDVWSKVAERLKGGAVGAGVCLLVGLGGHPDAGAATTETTAIAGRLYIMSNYG